MTTLGGCMLNVMPFTQPAQQSAAGRDAVQQGTHPLSTRLPRQE